MSPRKPSRPSTRSLTGAPLRGSTKKRTQSISQPTAQKSKKQKTQKPKTQKSNSAKVQKPKTQAPKSRNNSKNCLPSTAAEPPPTQSEIEPHERPGSDDQQADEEEQQEEEVVEDDAAEEEKQQEAGPFNFRTTWRALCGKEHLPGIRSGCYTKDTLFMYDIEQWKSEVLSNLRPKTFRVVSLVATASHEKCRQADEFPQELRSILDLDVVVECLEEWHKKWPQRALTLKVTLQLEEEKLIASTPALTQRAQPQSTQAQGRRTATTQQLNSLPQMLEAEERTGNHMPAIADRWACMNVRCRNKGKTCWRSKEPGAPDTAGDHFPVPSDLFRRWSKEVNDEISTVEKPSPQLIIAMSKHRDRSRNKESKSDQPSAATTEISTTSALLNAFIVTQLKQLNQQSVPAASNSTLLVERPALSGSSPFRTQKDPQDLLAEFFDWLVKQPGCNSERKIEMYGTMKRVLIEEEWELDTLRERRDGKGMTEDIWERYGFRLGTLMTIRSKISEFKLQRPQSSSSHSSGNASVIQI